MKKTWLSIGALASIITPVATIVSCGANIASGVAFTKGDNVLNFSINVPNAAGNKFAPYFANGAFNGAKLGKLAADINAAMTSNNVLKTKAGEDMELEVTILFTLEKPTDENNLVNYNKEYRFTQKIRFKLEAIDGASALRKNPLGFENNIIVKMLQGLAKAGLLKDIASITENDLVTTVTSGSTITLIVASTIAEPVQVLKDLAKKIDDNVDIPAVRV